MTDERKRDFSNLEEDLKFCKEEGNVIMDYCSDYTRWKLIGKCPGTCTYAKEMDNKEGRLDEFIHYVRRKT